MSVVALAAMTACGTDDNSPVTVTSTTGPLDCGGKDTVAAEGSTAQQNAIAVFNQTWGRACPGKNLSYNPTGSGAGIAQFNAGHVDFAGSDSPLDPEQVAAAATRCAGHPAWNLPLVFGPVALAYHLPGLESLVVSGDVLAKIYTGAVDTWNDPAIAALNPEVSLPGTTITPIYRSDASGTTDNFQKYLTAAAPQTWTKGAGKEFQGGAGEGAQKSAGVVQAVQATPGSIGYVEKGFADQAGLPVSAIDTGAGPVELTTGTARTAIDGARLAGDGHDLVLDLNSLYATRTPGAYPLVLTTYEIVCSRGYDAATTAAVKSFLTTSATGGQADLEAAGYIPLPPKFTQRLLASVDAIG